MAKFRFSSAVLPFSDRLLVPVPSQTGHATNTLQLAKQISQLTGLPVLDIVKGRKRASWYTLKLDALVGIDGTNKFFGFHLISDIKPYNPVIVDTVIDTGLTINAITKLFNKTALILTYGQVIRST
jgi:predicted amidophosphoribosyltransferase